MFIYSNTGYFQNLKSIPEEIVEENLPFDKVNIKSTFGKQFKLFFNNKCCSKNKSEYVDIFVSMVSYIDHYTSFVSIYDIL